MAGYDLLNEPNWDLPGGTALKALYTQIIDSIRIEDPDHMIFIEGNWFANDFTGLTPPWRDNLVYSPHKYWSYNDPGSIQWAIDIRDAHNVPLFFGESGENSNVWFRDAIRLMEDEGIGFAWWPMKKIESISCPLSVYKSNNYQILLDYWSNGGTQPTAVFAKTTLLQLAENLKLENCFVQKDVPDAIIRQVQTDETRPYNNNDIPGIIYATDFDMGRAGIAYFDNVDADYHLSTGSYTAWNNGWQYRNDGVDCEKSSDNVNSNGYNVGWIEGGEWMQYDINVLFDGVYDINVRIASGDFTGLFYLSVDGAQIISQRYVPHTGDYQTWETLTIPDVVLTTDMDKLILYSIGGGYNLGSLQFNYTGAMSEIATEFLVAKTTMNTTIQLELNKPLNALPNNVENDFEIFSNGTPLTILNAELDAQNSRIVHFEVDYNILYSDNLKISYNGTTVTSIDGSSLETFFLEDVENREPVYHPVPGTVEAEDYFNHFGTQQENTNDTGGGKNLAFLDVGDYMDYYINAASNGTYTVDYRTASESESGAVKLQIIDENGNATDIHNVTFPATGNWQTWTTTTSSNFQLSQGIHHLRVVITQPQFNFNWLRFNLITSNQELVERFETLSMFPNPTDGEFTIQGKLTEKDDVIIEVFNILGHNVLSKKLNNIKEFRQVLDLSNQAVGNYLVRIKTTNGSQKTMILNVN